MYGKWILAAVAVCFLTFAGPCRGQSRITDEEADRIADDILNGLDSKEGDKLFKLIAAPDPETIPDDQEEAELNENQYEVSARHWSKWATAALRVTRSIGQAVKTSLLSFFRNLRKATKYVLNKISETTKKVWQKLKDKFKGDLKEKVKKAGKKLVKKVLREVFEEGVEMAVEYVQALVIDYLHEKSEEELCECPQQEESVRCKCCVSIPGFAKACMVVRARPKLQWFVFSFRYNGTEFMKAKIAEDDRGPCQKGIDDVSRKVCKNLPHYLHFLHICFTPGDIYQTEDGGFVGCFTLSVDSLKLGVEKCVLFTPTETGIGETTIFSPTQLGLEEE